MTHRTLDGVLRPLLTAAGVLGAICQVLSAQAAGLALVGAKVYPAPDRSPILDGVVLVRDGKIAAVGSRSEIAPPASIEILDLTGFVLVPGFWNSHVHFMESQRAGADRASPTRQLFEAGGATLDVEK